MIAVRIGEALQPFLTERSPYEMYDTDLVHAGSTACWLCGGDARIDEQYRGVSLYRCGDCGFLFAPERSTGDLHGIYTDEYFEQYPGGESYIADETQRRYEAAKRLKWVTSYASGGRLMEIGAANGVFLDEARKAGFDVFGIEPAAGLAARARELFGVNVIAGFIETAKIPPEPFNAICAWHVLEHIREPQQSLRRLREALSDDGLLFLEIPNIASVRARRHGENWFHLDPENHVGFYTPEQLAELLGQAGFEVTETFSVSALSYLRPRLALRPVSLALRAYDTITTRSLQSRPHPYKHELLRAVARPA